MQVGAGLAKQLFAVVPPAAVTLLRLWSSAVVLLLPSTRAVWRALRPADRMQSRLDWRSLGVAAVFGLVLATMNFAIYQSFARIPLGVAVTIEFLGPLAVAVAASHRVLDLAWVALAGTGVALFRRRFAGSTGLTIAMVVGALAITPVGAVAGGAGLLDPKVLAIGAGIGLLSSVIPYSLELEALRRTPPRVFGILMSLEPAVAALVGLVLLGQVLSAREWFAIGCVMVACIGATRGDSATRPEV